MGRASERDLSLSNAERAAGGLSIGARLRVGIELLRSVAEGPPAPASPRRASSRLRFDRVSLSATRGIRATGEGDASGALLALWEILAGRPVGAEAPARLHDLVDDMPADVDDLVMDGLRRGAPAMTAAQLLEDLLAVAEPYALPLERLWDTLDATAPPSRGPRGTPSSRAPRTPAPERPASRRSEPAPAPSSRRAPRSTRAAPASTEASRAAAALKAPEGRAPAPTRTSATLPSMQAVVPPPAVRSSAGEPAARSAGEVVLSRPRAPKSVPPPRAPFSSRDPTLAPPPRITAKASPSRSTLLLVHAGAEGASLAGALRGAGYVVHVCHDAATALAHASAHVPICVVSDSVLPDADGEAVIRAFRSQPSGVAEAPFVLLATPEAAGRSTLRGAGADAYMSRPFTASLLVRQVDALVDMSSRLPVSRRSVPELPGPVDSMAAITADIRQVGVTAMLTLLDMEKRSGSFIVSGDGDWASSPRATLSEIDPNGRLEIELARGCVASASRMGIPAEPTEVVRAMMRLTVGRFSFKPMKKAAKVRHDDEAPTLREVLSEAARLEDEEAAGPTQSPRPAR